MNFRRFVFDKSSGSLENFNNLLQKTVNENNDLVSFRAYENPHSAVISVELVFGVLKRKLTEVKSFGIDRPEVVEEQVRLAMRPDMDTVFAGLVPYSKSNRAVGFLILEKVKEPANAKHEAQKVEANEQDPEHTAEPDQGTKRD